jgi:hypothetical protein
MILVVALVANLAGFSRLPGMATAHATTSMPIFVIAAAVILLAVTSRTGPQPR